MMSGDYDHVLVIGRCSQCGRVVTAPFGELRLTGIFACICGNITRARLRGADLPSAGPALSSERDDE
jgi:hypothetical protein